MISTHPIIKVETPQSSSTPLIMSTTERIQGNKLSGSDSGGGFFQYKKYHY